MSLEAIRAWYGVPARRGVRVRWRQPDNTVVEGQVTGAHGDYLRIRTADSGLVIHHPRSGIEYLTAGEWPADTRLTYFREHVEVER